jgi:putative ABC transport system substrate-binding protein
MYKRFVLITLTALMLFAGVPAEAQQSGEVPRIGVLRSGTPSSHASQHEAFRQGLRELGYIEGKISVSSTAMQRENSIASPYWRSSWSA